MATRAINTPVEQLNFFQTYIEPNTKRLAAGALGISAYIIHESLREDAYRQLFSDLKSPSMRLRVATDAGLLLTAECLMVSAATTYLAYRLITYIFPEQRPNQG